MVLPRYPGQVNPSYGGSGRREQPKLPSRESGIRMAFTPDSMSGREGSGFGSSKHDTGSGGGDSQPRQRARSFWSTPPKSKGDPSPSSRAVDRSDGSARGMGTAPNDRAMAATESLHSWGHSGGNTSGGAPSYIPPAPLPPGVLESGFHMSGNRHPKRDHHREREEELKARNRAIDRDRAVLAMEASLGFVSGGDTVQDYPNLSHQSSAMDAHHPSLPHPTSYPHHQQPGHLAPQHQLLPGYQPHHHQYPPQNPAGSGVQRFEAQMERTFDRLFETISEEQLQHLIVLVQRWDHRFVRTSLGKWRSVVKFLNHIRAMYGTLSRLLRRFETSTNQALSMKFFNDWVKEVKEAKQLMHVRHARGEVEASWRSVLERRREHTNLYLRMFNNRHQHRVMHNYLRRWALLGQVFSRGELELELRQMREVIRRERSQSVMNLESEAMERARLEEDRNRLRLQRKSLGGFFIKTRLGMDMGYTVQILFRGWKEHTLSSRHTRAVGKLFGKVLMRWKNRHLAMAITTWSRNVSETKVEEQRAIGESMLKSSERARMDEQKRTRDQMFRVVLGRLRDGLLSGGFHAWKEAVRTWQREDLIGHVEGEVGVLMHELSIAKQREHAILTDLSRQRHSHDRMASELHGRLLAKMLMRLQHRDVLGAWNRWRANCEEVRVQLIEEEYRRRELASQRSQEVRETEWQAHRAAERADFAAAIKSQEDVTADVHRRLMLRTLSQLQHMALNTAMSTWKLFVRAHERFDADSKHQQSGLGLLKRILQHFHHKGLSQGWNSWKNFRESKRREGMENSFHRERALQQTLFDGVRQQYNLLQSRLFQKVFAKLLHLKLHRGFATWKKGHVDALMGAVVDECRKNIWDLRGQLADAKRQEESLIEYAKSQLNDKHLENQLIKRRLIGKVFSRLNFLYLSRSWALLRGHTAKARDKEHHAWRQGWEGETKELITKLQGSNNRIAEYEDHMKMQKTTFVSATHATAAKFTEYVIRNWHRNVMKGGLLMWRQNLTDVKHRDEVMGVVNIANTRVDSLIDAIEEVKQREQRSLNDAEDLFHNSQTKLAVTRRALLTQLATSMHRRVMLRWIRRWSRSTVQTRELQLVAYANSSIEQLRVAKTGEKKSFSYRLLRRVMVDFVRLRQEQALSNWKAVSQSMAAEQWAEESREQETAIINQFHGQIVQLLGDLEQTKKREAEAIIAFQNHLRVCGTSSSDRARSDADLQKAQDQMTYRMNDLMFELDRAKRKEAELNVELQKQKSKSHNDDSEVERLRQEAAMNKSMLDDALKMLDKGKSPTRGRSPQPQPPHTSTRQQSGASTNRRR